MVFKGISRHKILIVLVSFLNFLFYLTTIKNLAYLYRQDVTSKFYFIIFLYVSFAGFALGLLMVGWIQKNFSKKNLGRIAPMLSFFILGTAHINFFQMNGLVPIMLQSFLTIFFPALFFGILYGLLLKKEGVLHNKMLFLLLIGSVLAVIIHSLAIIHFPFTIVFFLLFLAIQFVFCNVSRLLKIGELVIVLLAIIFFLINPPLENYTRNLSYPDKGEFKKVETSRGLSGILEVYHQPVTDSYIMFSDGGSPSHILKKGEIEQVQLNALIPYSVKEYDSALIIGLGGGQDIVAALYYNVSHVIGVEIDKQRIRLMQEGFKEYSNDLFFDKRLHVVHAGGREFLRKNNEQYNLIVIQRPWTDDLFGSYLFETSLELFTEEALEAYLDTLSEEGVLYWGLPVGGKGGGVEIIQALKEKLIALEDRVVIFHPYADGTFLSLLIGSSKDIQDFFENHKNEYTFLHPPPNGDLENNFFNSAHQNEERFIDKSVLWHFNEEKFKKRMLLLILLSSIIFLGGLAMARIMKSHIPQQYTSYFMLGIAYELVGFFFMIWLSHFFLNSILLFPIVLGLYFFISSFGYLHSEKVGRINLFLICLWLSFIPLFLITQNLFLDIKGSYYSIILTVFFFILLSYLVAFPFGYLVNREKHLHKALAIDYIGALVFLPLVFVIPHLDYIIGLAAFLYLCIGFLILLRKE